MASAAGRAKFTRARLGEAIDARDILFGPMSAFAAARHAHVRIAGQRNRPRRAYAEKREPRPLTTRAPRNARGAPILKSGEAP